MIRSWAALLALALPLAADVSPPRFDFNPARCAASRTIDAHRGRVTAISFAADGRRFATVGADRSIKIWSASADKPVRTVLGTYRGERLWMSRDARTIVAHGNARQLVVYNLDRDARDAAIENVQMWGFAVSPDGTKIAATTRDNRAVLFSARDGSELATVQEAGRGGLAYAWSPDGKRLAVLGVDRVTRVCDTEKGEVLAELENTAASGYDLQFSPDGKLVAFAGNERAVRLFDSATGKETLSLGDRTSPALRLAFSRDGRYLASGHQDGTLRLWDLKTGRELRKLDAHPGGVWSVAFTPDTRALVTGGADGKVIVWGSGGRAPAAAAAPRDGKPGFLGVTSDTDFEGPGVRIFTIVPGSAAEKAGLQAGDVVKSVGGKEVNSFDDLRAAVTSRLEGDEIEIAYTRGDADAKVKVKLGSRPSE